VPAPFGQGPAETPIATSRRGNHFASRFGSPTPGKCVLGVEFGAGSPMYSRLGGRRRGLYRWSVQIWYSCSRPDAVQVTSRSMRCESFLRYEVGRIFTSVSFIVGRRASSRTQCYEPMHRKDEEALTEATITRGVWPLRLPEDHGGVTQSRLGVKLSHLDLARIAAITSSSSGSRLYPRAQRSGRWIRLHPCRTMEIEPNTNAVRSQ
jgi:hypothetical protein